MTELISETRLQRLVEVGLAAAHRGRVARARGIFDGLLAYDPGFVPAQIGRAFSHLVVDEFEAAENLLGEILAARPDDPEARACLALVFRLSGRSEEAEDLCRGLAEETGTAAELARALLEAGK